MFHLASPFAAESRAVWTDFALTRLHIRHFVDRNVQFRSISFLSLGKKKNVMVLSSVTAKKGFCLNNLQVIQSSVSGEIMLN